MTETINMWEVIRKNQLKSFFFFILMGLLLMALGFGIGYYIGETFNIGLIGLEVAAGLWFIQSLVSYFGGATIALSSSNAKEVTQSVHPQLFNVVEEMKLAAGILYMPKIYIINDSALNAFATGRNPENSAIAVTAGLLSQLNRDELQGVIAHEMSHIVNRDILLMTFAGTMMVSIALLSDLFLHSSSNSSSSRRTSSNKNEGNRQWLIYLVVIILAVLGPMLAQLFYYAISRKREYLADASGVRLTRYPEGLASALEKISSSPRKLAAVNKLTAPLFIVSPLTKYFSTHPPIKNRIKILRGMGGNVDFHDYQSAFSQITGQQETLIPSSVLENREPVANREGLGLVGDTTKTEGKRFLNDLMRHVNNYQFISCPCGVKIKVPSNYKRSLVRCPKCHKVHSLKN